MPGVVRNTQTRARHGGAMRAITPGAARSAAARAGVNGTMAEQQAYDNRQNRCALYGIPATTVR